MPPSPPSDSGGEEPPLDDFIASDDEFRQPLPPDDRIWRHPSEVAAAARLQPTPTTKSAGRVSVATVAISALIGATLSLGIVAALGGFDDRIVERRVAVDMTDQNRGTTGTHAAVGLTTPSVVGVSVFDGDEWRSQNALILRSDGHLLTSAGLLRDSTVVEVHLAGGEALEADIVGMDLATDVAVIHVDNDDLTPAVIGSSNHIDVGDDAVSVGLLSGPQWAPVLTTCVVRAIGQRAQGSDATFHDVVVLDTDVPAETTGAPVLDGRGAVIGMLASPGVSSAAGGAVVIPIDDAIHIADEILEYGRARHVWLGIGGHDLTRDKAKAMQLEGGAVVSSVFPDSPAEAAGIEAGDVIIAVDGAAVKSMSELVVELRRHNPGITVSVSVARAGETTTIAVDLAERN